MPDSSHLCERAGDDAQVSLSLSLLNMPAYYTEGDTIRAAALMEQAGVRCLITLGGDGTNRAVARSAPSIPVVPLSTGTTNVFPQMIEGTLACLAAGLIATEELEPDWVSIYSKTLEAEGEDPLPTYHPVVEGQEDPKREQYPIQVLSSAAHYFIGDSFQSVPRLQAMMSRPTVEMSVGDAKERGIEDGDLVRLFNDRGETYCYAVVIEGLLDGVCATQKQFKGSNTPGGVNVNVLNSEMLTDFGNSPTFYSCLAEIEKADDEATKKARLEELGGVEGYIAAWRNKNRDSDLSDEQILEFAKKEHPGVFH